MMLGLLWYDREGCPISVQDANRKLGDREYKRVDATTLPDGKWVSTVWLGLNHRWGPGPPLIFETMVFESEENLEEVDMERYATENEAILGHQRMVAKYAGVK